MSAEIKYIICPHCGALLEKGVSFCGYCGKNVNEKDMSYTKPVQEKEKKPEKIYGKPPSGLDEQHELLLTRPGVKDSKELSGAEYIQRHALAESKIRNAIRYSWLSFCLALNFGIVGTIVAIIAIVNCLQARKLVGRDPRIARSMSWAIAAVVVGIVITVFYILAFRYGWI